METLKTQNFTSPKNGKSYTLYPADQLPSHSAHAEVMAEICNQDDVLLLFHFLKGRPYEIQDAAKFLESAREGWASQSHFVFFVTTSEGQIAAALDVKSNNKIEAEIGYWCDQRHRGITSSAVMLMMAWAKREGFKTLCAEPINTKSAALLKRVGFAKKGSSESLYGRWAIAL